MIVIKENQFKERKSDAIYCTKLCLSTFTSTDALDPCVIEVCVAVISTVVEPSTATSTTAELAVLSDSAALETPGNTAAHYGRNHTCSFCGRSVHVK